MWRNGRGRGDDNLRVVIPLRWPLITEKIDPILTFRGDDVPDWGAGKSERVDDSEVFFGAIMVKLKREAVAKVTGFGCKLLRLSLFSYLFVAL